MQLLSRIKFCPIQRYVEGVYDVNIELEVSLLRLEEESGILLIYKVVFEMTNDGWGGRTVHILGQSIE